MPPDARSEVQDFERRDLAGVRSDREPSPARQASATAPDICECGHPIAEHAWSGWGEHTVCVEKLDDENAGWYGVCPCVRHGDEYPDAGMRGQA